MSADQAASGHDAKVVPLRADDAGHRDRLGETEPPAYPDTSGTDAGKRLPIMPEHLRRTDIRRTAGRGGRAALVQGPLPRVPLPGLPGPDGGVRGARCGPGHLAGCCGGRTGPTGWVLESLAVAAGRSGHHDAMSAHMQGKQDPRQPVADRRRVRGGRGGRAAGHGPLAAVVGLAGRRWWPRCAGAGPARRARTASRSSAPRSCRRLPAAHPGGHHPRAGLARHRRDQRRRCKDGRRHRVRLRRAPRRRRAGAPSWTCRTASPPADDPRPPRSSSPPGCAARCRRPGPSRCRTSTPGGCTCGSGFHDISKAKPSAWPLLRTGHGRRVRPRAVRHRPARPRTSACRCSRSTG